MTKGGALLAKWSVGYFVVTTLIAIAHSTVMVSQVWAPMMRVVSEESRQISEKDKKLFEERQAVKIDQVVADMFNSLVTDNPVNSLAQNHFLAVLVCAVVVGYLIKPGGALLRGITEIDKLITTVITALIKMAPIGVFFLILPNLFRLNIAEIGYNLAILIAGTLTGIFFHLLVVFPLIYIAFIRKNPYLFWFKNSAAWITAWGTASSAATLPVTLRVIRERGVPEPIVKFVVPLGCLVNMDG
jgi:Na+/H+-dicarboxylate symporter